MTISIVERLQALKESAFYGQIALQNVPADFDHPYGKICLIGKIVRIFKVSIPLNINDIVQFELAVVMREKGIFPDGGMICWYEDILAKGYVEICLNGTPPLFTIAADLCEVISAPTEEPVIFFDEKENIVPEKIKWWKIW